MRDIIVDADAKDVSIPSERYFETRRMMKCIDIQEGAMEAYTKASPDYIDGNGEAVITRDIEALVKGLIQRCAKYKLSPMGVLYHTFVSIDDPKSVKGLLYFNAEVDPTHFRKPKMLEFESAIRYLGLPLSIETAKDIDFVSCDYDSPCVAPVGVRYAVMCKPGARVEIDPWHVKYVRMEFVVPWTDELNTYLPDMENRYYAYKDGEESGWRL